MSGPSQPPPRHAGEPLSSNASTARLSEAVARAEDPAMTAQGDLRYLVRRMANLGVICAKHTDDRMAMLVEVTRDGLAYIERSPGVKTAYGALMRARVGYSHGAELEETTWATVVQAGQGLVAALQGLPEADPRALRGLPEECFLCRRRLSGHL